MQFEKHVCRGPDQRSKDAHHEGQPHKRVVSCLYEAGKQGGAVSRSGASKQPGTSRYTAESGAKRQEGNCMAEKFNQYFFDFFPLLRRPLMTYKTSTTFVLRCPDSSSRCSARLSEPIFIAGCQVMSIGRAQAGRATTVPKWERGVGPAFIRWTCA